MAKKHTTEALREGADIHRTTIDTKASKVLEAGVKRIERLTEEKDAISSDIKDVYKELEGNGFDRKVVAEVVRLRKMDEDERREAQAILETYMHALGMDD